MRGRTPPWRASSPTSRIRRGRRRERCTGGVVLDPHPARCARHPPPAGEGWESAARLESQIIRQSHPAVLHEHRPLLHPPPKGGGCPPKAAGGGETSRTCSGSTG